MCLVTHSCLLTHSLTHSLTQLTHSYLLTHSLTHLVDMSFDIRSTSTPSSPDNSLLNSSLLASPHAKMLASSQTFGLNEAKFTGDFDDDDSFDVGSK